MKFIGIVGTNANKSYNRMLLTFMQKHFSHQAEIEILELTEVPLFDESKDQSNSEIIQLFNTKITEADGVIIATPEHNHSIPNCSIGCKRISVGNVKINLIMFVRAVGINLIAPVVVYF